MNIPKIIETDYLVIGSGLAGLYFAAHAAEHGKVLIITKREVEDSNTFFAQAGIAAVLDEDDSFKSHASDTIRTGAGLCNEKIVNSTVRQGPDRIHDLMENFDIQFSKNKNGKLNLGLEGGHSHRRVAHIGDISGITLMEKLKKKVYSLKNVTVMENHMAVDLLSMSKYGEQNSCFGAFVLGLNSNRIDTIVAKATIIASGGAGKVYLYTSNPDTSAGDGIAIAYRIGAEVANMEFYQFHPTLLYHHKAKSFLISESLRGEGGILKREDGSVFMTGYHPDAELASRDIVARAIDSELKRTGDDSVFLDMTHLDKEFVKNRFPLIHKKCLEFGINMLKEKIPVVPAAHYSCGGIQTDEWGRTNVKNLYAIGEAAHTGFHGACRLASNSLLEALVFGYNAAQKVKESELNRPLQIVPWKSGTAVSSDEVVVVTHTWDEIRRTMWNYVGIVRSTKRLERAINRIKFIRNEIKTYYWDFIVTPELLELRNLSLVADLIAYGALRRLESRGLHYTIDYPESSNFYAKDTLLHRGIGPDHT
jgi:L-aspartate oxidase